MNKIVTASIACLILSVSVAKTYAAEEYYVEIGKQESIDAVKANWESLSGQHKALLGKLTLYPKTIIQADGTTAAVIQAGPITDKTKAQRLCGKLFAKDISCFVIEGLEKPPTMSIGMAQAMMGAAAASKNVSAPAPVAAVEPEKKTEVLGAIAAPKATGEAKVAVAEAIPVPLSSDKPADKAEVKVAEKAAPVMRITAESPAEKKPAPAIVPSAVVTNELPPVEFADGAAGWLTVSAFNDEKAANNFWQDIRSRSPQLAAGLRVRVLKPLLARGGAGVRLTVGPFPSNAAAQNFCTQAVQAYNPQLNCGFEAVDAPVSKDVESAPVKFDQGNRYEQRRERLEQQRRAPAAKSGKRAAAPVEPLTHDDSERTYWAQVVIADSKSEAQTRLEDIMSANGDVLSGISGRISSNPTRKSKFTVRLGPLAGESAANELCETLQTRSLDCLVVGTK